MKHNSLTESRTLQFSEAAKKMKAEGKKIISLGLGEPTFDTPKEIIKETIRAVENGYTKYSSAQGLSELREIIATKLQSENRIPCTRENIVVTPGAKQALYLSLLALLEPYDEIINITPCYVSYIPQIKLAEPSAKIVNVDLERYNHTLPKNEIEKATTKKTKVIIVNTPHNPTGKVYKKNEIEWIAEWAKKNNLWIISDEVYEKLLFSEIRHTSIASCKDMHDKTITINGLSKTYSMTGWRIGYLCAPLSIVKTIVKIQQHINTNTCTFIQRGACKAFSLPDSFLTPFITQLKKNVDVLTKVIKKNTKLSLVQPEGSFFAFVNIEKTKKSSDNFATTLLQKTGVATTPGIAFGWDDHIRISLAQEPEIFKRGIELIDKFTREE